jgi:hypothetical protein
MPRDINGDVQVNEFNRASRGKFKGHKGGQRISVNEDGKADTKIIGLDGNKLENTDPQIILDKETKQKVAIEKEIKEIRKYNESLFEDDPILEGLTFHKNEVVIRLFKWNPHRKTSTGLSYMYEPRMIGHQSDPKKDTTYSEDPLQFYPVGVIKKISKNTSEKFREVYKVNDVVTMTMGIHQYEAMFYPNVIKAVHGNMLRNFEGYFLFNENLILCKNENKESVLDAIG